MKSKFNLDNKVVIITGGAGLLGKAFAKSIIELGGISIIADVNEKLGNSIKIELSKELNSNRIDSVKVDISSEASVKNMIRYVLKKYKKIDALVNNAYPRNKNYGRKFEDVEYDDFCENVNMHLGGYFLITKEISKVMTKQNYGNIINIASIYGFSAPRFEIYEGTDMTVPIEYSTIKGAIISITRYLASYLGGYNIRVNSISPGGVYNNQPKEFVKEYSNKVPLGKRMARTDDLTGVLIFLLSDSSGYITGQNIVVDGGWSL